MTEFGRPILLIGVAVAAAALTGCSTPPYAAESVRSSAAERAAAPSAAFDLDAVTPNGMVGLPPVNTIAP